MERNITYHPISEREIHSWYCDLEFSTIAEDVFYDLIKIARNQNLDDFYVKKYIETMKVAVKTAPDEIFDETHGYYIALIQGYFRKYYYINEGSLSELIDQKEYFKKYYVKKWGDILDKKISNSFLDKIKEGQCSGVYLPADKVIELLNDYQNDEIIKNDLDAFFAGYKIDVFLNALRFAKENECGLLEANEVIIPNPFDLELSKSYSTIESCDKDSILLFQKATKEKLLKKNEVEIKEQESLNVNKKEEIRLESKEKIGIWKKIFG